MPDVTAFALSVLRPLMTARMRATCTIDRPGAPTTSADGEVTCTATRMYPDPGWEDDHPYSAGPCYARVASLVATAQEAGGRLVTVSPVVVRVPHGVTFWPGDVVTWVTDVDNPGMVGKVLRVTSVSDQSQGTAQRLTCDDYQGPPLVTEGS